MRKLHTTSPWLPSVFHSAIKLVRVAAIILSSAGLVHAGGPKYIAGSSYFNSGTMGQPLTWPLGVVNYYTDQGT